MTVVADTTPLNYLVLIDQAHVLPALFERVLLPRAVFLEMQNAGTPEKVRLWSSNEHPWLEIRTTRPMVSQGLDDLDPGEREAIQLALSSNLNTVLIDDYEGRRMAQTLRLEVLGTLGILERAGRLGMLDLGEALRRLMQTNFRMSAGLHAAIRQRNGL
jgi:predicted nucleic acid-binding protein